MLLKIAEMEYSGANSIFLRIFFDKKYAMPYRVIDSVVFHFLRWLVAIDIFNGQPRPIFVYFRSFQQQFYRKIVHFSWNWTRIIGVEGKNADHHHGEPLIIFYNQINS